jgi:hypothetical protein
MKRKTRRTFTETKQVALVVDSISERSLACEICTGNSRLVSPLLAAQILQTDTRVIYRLIESGEIHFVETDNKQLFVCLWSLAEASARQESSGIEPGSKRGGGEDEKS